MTHSEAYFGRNNGRFFFFGTLNRGRVPAATPSGSATGLYGLVKVFTAGPSGSSSLTSYLTHEPARQYLALSSLYRPIILNSEIP